MKSSKHLLLCASALLLTLGADAATWLTDLPSTLTRAVGENKLVLINFTGSDWCPACIELQKQFASPEFNQYADNVYLVEIDFPRRKPQGADVKRVNQALAQKYAVESYPTLLLLNGDGAAVAKVERDNSPAVFVSKLKEQVDANSPVALARKAREREPVEPLPLFGGAPTAPPPKYTDLALKSVTGPKNRRLALINNQTFAPGEAALVRLGDGQVKVRCVEIRDKSVVVAIDGGQERRELRLPESL
jgi:thiol-disulfide isomerase/thioredoxin